MLPGLSDVVKGFHCDLFISSVKRSDCRHSIKVPLHEKCLYSGFFWSVFFCIQTEYGEILCISPHSVRMQENNDRKTPNTDTFNAVYIKGTFKVKKGRNLKKS